MPDPEDIFKDAARKARRGVSLLPHDGVETRNSAVGAAKGGWQTNRFLFLSFRREYVAGGGQSTFSMSSTIVLDARAKPETRATKY